MTHLYPSQKYNISFNFVYFTWWLFLIVNRQNVKFYIFSIHPLLVDVAKSYMEHGRRESGNKRPLAPKPSCNLLIYHPPSFSLFLTLPHFLFSVSFPANRALLQGWYWFTACPISAHRNITRCAVVYHTRTLHYSKMNFVEQNLRRPNLF